MVEVFYIKENRRAGTAPGMFGSRACEGEAGSWIVSWIKRGLLAASMRLMMKSFPEKVLCVSA